MIEESVIKSVLEGTDIVRLVGEYVQLKRIGRSVKGLCPFHQEKTPSFHVNAERHAYHCFGCGVGGNAVDFLMRMENLSFPEAVERLAERLGIEVRRSMDNSPVSSSRVREKQGLLGTMKLAQEFFLGFIRNAECSLHIKMLSGKNTHHILEGAFKSVARTLRKAVQLDEEFKNEIPSTKGVL